MSFQVGDLVKNDNRVFKVTALTKNYRHGLVPDGWLIDKHGIMVNPRYCEKHKGAESAIVDA